MKNCVHILDEYVDLFLDFLFPPNCFGCNSEGNFICKKCIQKINSDELHYFINSNFQKVYVLNEWSEEIVQKAIHQLKFRFAKKIVNNMIPLIEQKLIKIDFPLNSIFVPVPLHSNRKNERGFNQSEIISNAFTKITKIPTINNLIYRNRNTFPQSKLHGISRRENVKDAFSVNVTSENIDKNTTIFIIDDVASTCSTIGECAKILRKSGFKNINAIVLASDN